MVNHKKLERLWREEGLQFPQLKKKRKRHYQKDSFVIRLRRTHPNHFWAIRCPDGDCKAINRKGALRATSSAMGVATKC